ncbi:unnamed protein product [Rotaria sp. Silwood2]|nr:unnamed protein product [Rotaria sp. Silwood2]CAF3323421.1 unnamed protein product [Rotaria sp. Silwood2]CAF3963857.1 unnamed protein product [Rotaria sp. Silwood2]CAF4434814.1 unnamed protein product [Rotaria sp. Silwood2]
MDNNTMTSTVDTDLFVDSEPMNDEELTKLHESTLQMFRSNKIGPKNAFDIVLIDYLPAIFEGTSFDDDNINNFQSVGTTLETSAKIYAARIDSLYSETRKAQSILRSTNENIYRILDDEYDIEGDNNNNINEDNFSEKRISNNKKIRLLMKRKKSIVTDRNKLLRKNRNDEFRPIMINQFFLSAMNNDNILLSELYDKMNISPTINENKKSIKQEQNDILSPSLHSNDFVCDSLSIDTTNSSIISNDNDLCSSTDMNITALSSQLLTPTSLTSSSTMNISNTPIRSRTNSITSNSSILTNAANLFMDIPNEYSYLDSTKVNAFINEINNNNTKLDDIIISPSKLIRKRRLSIEYPFPFLVEQAKKQRMTPKKLREQLLKHNLLLRPPSPEYEFSPFDNTNDLTNNINDFILPNSSNTNINDLIISNSPLILKRQRAIDFRHLQTNMKQIIFKHFETEKDIFFSEIYSNIHQDDNQQISSSDIGICFAALLNNSVRYQLILESNDIQDDIRISSPLFNNNQH